MRRYKTEKEYEDLFETLMDYTNFTNVVEVEEKGLPHFFKKIDEDRAARGIKPTTSREFMGEMQGAFVRLLNKRIVTRLTMKEKTQSYKAYKHFKSAKEGGHTFVYEQQEVYKSIIHIKKKSYVKYRNNKGRFAKVEFD